jgi:hypothetical protein
LQQVEGIEWVEWVEQVDDAVAMALSATPSEVAPA